MKKWQLKEVDGELVSRLSAEAGISGFISHLLVGRGIVSRDMADEYFNGDEISSPYEIADMDKAVKAIRSAVEKGEKITVYGDYDCDGITSTVILFNYFQSQGAEADWYIPSREEGYGLSFDAIDTLAASGTKLVVTVDNGISAVEEAEYIYQKGMKLVITDHHQVPETLPRAEAVVDPHRSDDFCSCKDLAGCGVALKLVMALEEDIDSIVEQWGDFAAIGTVGDLVPLTGENRRLVKRGLENMLMTENVGLYALLAKCGITDEERLNSTALGFTVCPRINAAGRFAHPAQAAELFLCENERLAPAKAEELTSLNEKRQQTEKEILAQIEEKISADRSLLNKRVLVLSGDNWSHGVIGIVASRLLNKYGKPCLIITKEGQLARGSARSVPGFSLYKLLDNLKGWLTKYGGHTKAAGFSLHSDEVERFTEAVHDYAARNYPTMPVDLYLADKELAPDELTVDNIRQLDYLQPFGEENPVPLFIMRNCRIKSLRSLKDGKYTAFNVDFGGREYKVLNFSAAFADFWYKVGDQVDLLVNADINEYNGKTSITLKLKEMRFSGFKEEKFFAAKSAYEKLSDGEPMPPVLIKRIIPEKRDLKQAYDIIRGQNVYSAAVLQAFAQGINYCMFRVCLDVFEESGLITADIPADRITLVPRQGKADLDNSKYLSRLKEQILSAEGGNTL